MGQWCFAYVIFYEEMARPLEIRPSGKINLLSHLGAILSFEHYNLGVKSVASYRVEQKSHVKF